MKDRGRWIIGALCILYVAVRLWRLTDGCLWFDEIFGVHAAEHSWGGMFWFVAQDLIHPPLFYVLLKLWIAIGGEGLLWLRLFPVFFSVLALFPFLHLCKELKLTVTATAIALAFFAVNGSLIKYAQEVRMYSVMLFVSLFSIWLFARFFFRGKNIWVLTFVNVLLVHTHYFGWFVVFSELVAIALLQRIKIRHVLVMAGIAVVSFVPWVLALWRAARAGSEVSQNIGWIKPPGARSIFEFIVDVVEPFHFQMSSVDPGMVAWVALPLLVLIAAAAADWIATWKSIEFRDRVWVLGIIVLIPSLSAFLLSWSSPYSFWGVRHLTIVFAPALILIGIFLSEAGPTVLRSSMLTAAGGLMLAAGIRYAAMPPQEQVWCAWEKLAASIPAEGPQTVYAFEDLSAYHLWFATRKRGSVSIVKVEGMPGMIEDRAYFLPRGFDGVGRIDHQEITGEGKWIAFRDVRWNEKHPPMNWLKERGYSIGEPITFDAKGMKAFLLRVDDRQP